MLAMTWQQFGLTVGLLLAVCLLAGAAAQAVDSGRLVMFESEDCTYCAAWDREVGGIYALTDEGQRLLLERRHIEEQEKVPGLQKRVRFTPTFVVMVKEREIGRIEGYQSEYAFWGLLNQLMEPLGKGLIN